MKNLTLRLEEEKIEELEQEAEEAGISRSEYIRRILSQRNTDESPGNTGEHSDETTVSQAEYSAIQMQCAMLMQTMQTLQTQVDRLTEENKRLTTQLESTSVPAIEDERSSSVFSRIRRYLSD